MRRASRYLLRAVVAVAVVILILDVVTRSWTALVGDLAIAAATMIIAAAFILVRRRRRR